MIYLTERITLDEGLCNGKPTIRGLRIAVQSVLEYLSTGNSKEEILMQFPDLVPEDIEACLSYASQLMSKKYVVKIIAA
jgi:uncharacterized protein (DUF433 family)